MMIGTMKNRIICSLECLVGVWNGGELNNKQKCVCNAIKVYTHIHIKNKSSCLYETFFRKFTEYSVPQ
jgi:hypothetical protein